jgi:hypothetical protein
MMNRRRVSEDALHVANLISRRPLSAVDANGILVQVLVDRAERDPVYADALAGVVGECWRAPWPDPEPQTPALALMHSRPRPWRYVIWRRGRGRQPVRPWRGEIVRLLQRDFRAWKAQGLSRDECRQRLRETWARYADPAGCPDAKLDAVLDAPTAQGQVRRFGALLFDYNRPDGVRRNLETPPVSNLGIDTVFTDPSAAGTTLSDDGLGRLPDGRGGGAAPPG